jgi:hypothetical protein
MRARYRYDKDLDAVVEIHDHNGPETRTDHRFIPDIQPFALPDGTQITSRSVLREYEAKHGVKQCGNDWTGSSKPQWWDAWNKGELRG